MHGHEQLLVHVPHITAAETIHGTLRVSRTGERARPALRSLECREGRAGRRPEVDDPII